MDENTARQIAKLFASKFIARPDRKAFQRANGDWYPEETPITMPDLLAHLRGERTMGHYMLSPKSEVKLFAFDIDLEKASPEKEIYWPMPTGYDTKAGEWIGFADANPRGTWERISEYADIPWMQEFLEYQLWYVAHRICRAIETTLQIPYAVAYSGHKGLHVYGFTGLCSAEEARDGAQIVLDHTGCFEPARGKSFFKHKRELDYNTQSCPQVSVEMFPKQTTLEGQKGFGNLMRLPLGVHQMRPLTHPHHAKFIDLRARGAGQHFIERDPIEALTVTDQLAGAIPK